MARGESGRIVLEIDPSQKDELYTALIKDGLTLKEWFLQQASHYLRDRSQIPLFVPLVVAEDQARYRVKSEPDEASAANKKKHRRRAKGG